MGACLGDACFGDVCLGDAAGDDRDQGAVAGSRDAERALTGAALAGALTQAPTASAAQPAAIAVRILMPVRLPRPPLGSA